MSEQMQKPPIEAWKIQHLRFTLFPAQPIKTYKNDWWAEVNGMSPENQVINPREPRQQDSGGFEEGLLQLDVVPTRVDWNYVSIIEASDEGKLIAASLGSFAEASKIFVDLCNRWVNTLNDIGIRRIAFGGVALQPTDTTEAAYRLLSEYVPNVPDSREASDFLYQINRWRTHSVQTVSGAQELKINRLSKWSAGQLIQTVLGPPKTDSMKLGESIYARLEFDINTDGEWEGAFSPEVAAQILAHLVDLAQEIAAEGDIP
jgi:hypothetical protein